MVKMVWNFQNFDLIWLYQIRYNLIWNTTHLRARAHLEFHQRANLHNMSTRAQRILQAETMDTDAPFVPDTTNTQPEEGEIVEQASAKKKVRLVLVRIRVRVILC